MKPKEPGSTASEPANRGPEPPQGVCYHCRQAVWDGQRAVWNGPVICPHCKHQLVLASPESAHRAGSR